MVLSRLYTWIDVQDSIESHFSNDENQIWLSNINFRAYWDGLTITFSSPKIVDSINEELEKIFLSRFRNDHLNSKIILESGKELSVFYEEVEEEDIESINLVPSLNRNSFVGPKSKKLQTERDVFEKPFIYAFHSFKGGVGRTLHALALAINLSEKNKVLLIDADFEAPGISWLFDSEISFSDYLAMIHSSADIDLTTKDVANILKNETIQNLTVLPAFRTIRKRANIIEVKPENIFKFNDNPFILTDTLISLGKELTVDYIIIDLRAGVSELSSGWFLDPRVFKVFVTTLSSQSLLGTSMMFRTLNRFEKNNDLKNSDRNLPAIIISQIPSSTLKDYEANWGENLSTESPLLPLRNSYADSFINTQELSVKEIYKDLTEEQIIGRVISPITTFSELYDSLKSLPDNWDEIYELIKQSKLDRNVSKLVEMAPLPTQDLVENFVESRSKLLKITNDLIFAESRDDEDFLITEPIRNLVNNYRTQVPIAVVVGAKGSGKTFLYNQIVNFKDWKLFSSKVNSNLNSNGAVVLPVTIPANFGSLEKFLSVPESLSLITEPKVSRNVWQDITRPDIQQTLKNDLSTSDWREKWLDYIAWAAGFNVGETNVGRAFIEFVKVKNIKVLAVFDGLEDLFQYFNTDLKQQTAIASLLQDLPNWLQSQSDKNLGAIVLVRRDIITSAISQNAGQFLKKYENFELKWNVEEALRLVHWILNFYSIFNEPTFEDWRSSLSEKKENELIQSLYKLWGMRMAKDSSKEAYSHNWILGSLANLKKEVQSRDIVRFLMYAAEKSTNILDPKIMSLYAERLLFPSAIRDSIDEVGRKKVEEVKIENLPLKQVLETLENHTSNIKFPAQPEDLKKILTEEKQIRVLEDNGVLVLYNGEYYMAELYRKGIGFEYSRKGKPKVLYF